VSESTENKEVYNRPRTTHAPKGAPKCAVCEVLLRYVEHQGGVCKAPRCQMEAAAGRTADDFRQRSMPRKKRQVA